MNHRSLPAMAALACSLAALAATSAFDADAAAPAKDAPMVALLYPPANAIIDLTLTPVIALEGTVIDADETVGTVVFSACRASAGACVETATSIGTLFAPPYRLAWRPPLSDAASSDPVSQGYLFWLSASNSLGQSRQSAPTPVTLYLSGTPPRVTLVAPNPAGGDAGFVAPASPVLYATATSAYSQITRVEFLDGASVLGSLSAPNSGNSGFAFVWSNAPSGAHLVSARAVDAAGHASISAPVALYVVAEQAVPQVQLAAPSTGQVFPPHAAIPLTATVNGASNAIQRVEFAAGATTIATVFAPPYNATWNDPPAGHFTIVARAFDQLGIASASPAAYVEILSSPRGPSVVLTSPVPDSKALAGNPVSLRAAAAGGDNAISRVDFLAGTTLIGSASMAPYAFAWSSPPPGVHVLSAKTYDVKGVSAASTPVTISIVTTTPPRVTLSAPASGAKFAAPAAIKLRADATATDAFVTKVEFFANGLLLGTRTAAPYEWNWTGVAPGTYSLTAKVTDTLGGTGSATAISVSVVTDAPPTVSVTAPAGGQTFYAGQPITLAAAAADSDGTVAKVEFLVDGNVIAALAGAPYAWTWNGGLVGAHTIAARATDNLGVSTTSLPASVTIAGNAVPTVALTAPVSGDAFVAAQSVTLAATASDPDGTIARVEFLVDGTVIGGVSSAPFTFAWSAKLGTHLLAARATDNRGATATSAPVTVSVNSSSAPSVALALPQANETFAAGAVVHLTATAASAAGAITRVDFYAGTTLIGSANSRPYTVDWPNPPVGAHSLSAKAVDARGGLSTSSTTQISVIQPALAIVEPAPDAAIPADFVLVTGTYSAPPNSGITVNGIVARNDGAGRYFVNNLPLDDGSNTITVTLTTPNGQTLTRTRPVTRTATAPMRLYTEPDRDFAPATFTIRLDDRTGTPYTNVLYQNLGGGQADTSLVDQTTLGKLTFSAPGIYYPRLVVTDSTGATYAQTLAVLVQDSAAADQAVKRIWSAFTLGLGASDRGFAQAAVNEPARTRLSTALDVLMPYMPAIVSGWAAPVVSNRSDGVAEIGIMRKVDGIDRVFLIYLLEGGDGVWRIDSF